MKQRIVPNVLVPGFPRAGTSYLYNLLKQHKDIDVTSEKEIGWWRKFPLLTSHPKLINMKFFYPRIWYYKKFKVKKKIIMDFSVMASYDKTSARRIRKELGNIKIIFVIRDKEQHQRSIRNSIIKHHGEKIRIDTSIYSNFEKYIDEYKRVFESVMIVHFEDLTKNTNRTLKEIYSFLELDYHGIDTDIYEKSYKVKFKDKDKKKSEFSDKIKFFKFRVKRNIWKTVSFVFTRLFSKSDFRN